MSKFQPKPPTNDETEAGLVDYSTSFTKIELAVSTLRDTLCGGDVEKVEDAYESLKNNVEILGHYLVKRGLDVHPR